MTRRVHCRTQRYDIYIGRSNDAHSIFPHGFGNPYTHYRYSACPGIIFVATRAEAVNRFERDVRSNPEFMARIKRELKGKTLGCWCDEGELCHCDVLIDIADEDETLNQQGELMEDQQIIQRALSFLDRARTLVITDQRSYDVACAALREVVTERRVITDYHSPLKKKAHEAHQAICDAETESLKPVADAEFIIKRSIGVYEREQMRVQEEMRLKAKAEAEAAAEAERKRQIAEAEANATRQLDAAMEEAETFEEACAIADAREQVLAGARQEAKSEPMPIISYEVEPAIYKHPGVSTTVTYAVEVEDIKDLCRAIADGKAAIELVLPNLPALNKIAKALKKHFSIPGCRIVEINDVRARSLPRNR